MTDVFVYGTLMFSEVLQPLLGFLPKSRPATLEGYRRVEATLGPRCNFPIILPSAGTGTDGLVLLDLNQRALGCLDEFEETASAFYIRRTLSLKDGSHAEGYIPGPALERCLRKASTAADRQLAPLDRLLTKPWDPDEFRQRDLDEYVRRVVGQS